MQTCLNNIILGIYNIMSTLSKSTTRSIHNKAKEHIQQNIYLYDDYLLIIYHAQFYQQYLLLCTKDHLMVYQINKEIIVNSLKLKTHTASFIPHTNYIAFVYYQHEKQKKNRMSIWDYKINKIVSNIQFNFQIESLKSSHWCIILSSLQSLYVIHFPSLKPIYNNLAGNGFNIVYDISQQGLTLAFNSHKKGEILIRNFTNIETNKLLAQIKSNHKSVNDRIKANSARLSSFTNTFDNYERQKFQVKEIIRIKAHTDNISLLRLSPNGYRVISCSYKGTVIRLFSCLTGQLMSAFSMSSSLTMIIDVKFISQGNSIVCLNDYNEVKLFHTKMIEEQIISQRTRRKFEIYQMQNPKSFFSFLWFLDEKFSFQRPFAYLTLSTLNIIKQESHQQKKSKLQRKVISIIKQQHHDHDHESLIQEQQHNESIQKVQTKQKDLQIQKSSQKDKIPKNGLSQQSLELVISDDKQDQKCFLKKGSMFRSSNESVQLKLKEKISSRRKSDKNLLKDKGLSLKSLISAKKHTQIISMKHNQKDLNFKGIIDFSGNININVIRCKYFYKLKYDPFNGGQMFESKSYNLLHHPVLKQQL